MERGVCASFLIHSTHGTHMNYMKSQSCRDIHVASRLWGPWYLYRFYDTHFGMPMATYWDGPLGLLVGLSLIPGRWWILLKGDVKLHEWNGIYDIYIYILHIYFYIHTQRYHVIYEYIGSTKTARSKEEMYLQVHSKLDASHSLKNGLKSTHPFWWWTTRIKVWLVVLHSRNEVT